MASGRTAHLVEVVVQINIGALHQFSLTIFFTSNFQLPTFSLPDDGKQKDRDCSCQHLCHGEYCWCWVDCGWTSPAQIVGQIEAEKLNATDLVGRCADICQVAFNSSTVAGIRLSQILYVPPS